MTDRLAASELRHFKRLQRRCGIVATIKRGDQTINDVAIVLAATNTTAVTTRQSQYSADTQELLIEAADYAQLGEPADADRFTYQEAGQQVTAEARSEGDSVPCFTRWRGGMVFRVRCKIRERSNV